MLNKVILIGRLTRDPELRYTPQGTAVTNFGIAVDRGRRNAQGESQADFFNVVVWRKAAENVAQYITKGRLVAVEGRLQSRSYEQDGRRRTAIEVVAQSVQFLDYAKDTGSNKPPTNSHEMHFDDEDEDLPF